MNLRSCATLGTAFCCALFNISVSAQTKLSEGQFNRIFICDWIMLPESERDASQAAAAQAFSKFKFIDDPRTNIPAYKDNFRALGTQFDLLSVAGMDGAGYLSMQGAQASREAMLKYFAGQNRPLSLTTGAIAPSQNSALRWMRNEVSPDYTLTLFVQDGAGEFEVSERSLGASAYCMHGETSAEDALKLGLEPISEVGRVVDANVDKPPTWGNAIIASGSMRRMRMLARYKQLTPDQASGLLRRKDSEVTRILIENFNIRLSSSELDSLIADPVWVSSVALTRFDMLNAIQRRKVMGSISPAVRDTLALRVPGAASDALLMRLIDEGNPQTVLNALRQHNQPNSEHIDRVLASPSVELRREFTLSDKFMPTAAQIERIMADPDPGVRIGLLRRKDVKIPDQLILKGIDHPDKICGFGTRKT